MSILNITQGVVGAEGVVPRMCFIETDDTLAEITTTGYLNNTKDLGYFFAPTDLCAVTTVASPGAEPTVGWFEIQKSGTNTSLVPTAQPGSVTLPTIANHIATYTNTTGGLSEDATRAINGGGIDAGLSGTAGTLRSYSSTAARGYLEIAGVANTGNTATTLSNVAMGQATTVSIPDPANALGRLLIGATATPFVSGNIPAASGTGGLMVDSGVAATDIVQIDTVNTFTGAGQIILQKADGTEAANAVTASGNAGLITTSALTTAAAGSYAITWTNTKITATSVIAITRQGGTNTRQMWNYTVVGGAGSATLTIYNNEPTNALNGTIIMGYTVL